MVRLFLSSIKYVHTRQRDEARRRAETDRSVKERIANDNAHKETGIINGVLSFQSRLFARHLYSHAWFNTLLAMLGSIHHCYVNGGGRDELLLLLLRWSIKYCCFCLCSCSYCVGSGSRNRTELQIESIGLATMTMKAEATNYCCCCCGVVMI